MKSFFNSNNLRQQTRLYEHKDDVISSDALSNPPLHFNWLPSPGRRIEMNESDVISVERSARLMIRALNYLEVILQAWEQIEDEEDQEYALNFMSKAIKMMFQNQISLMCSVVLVRRDHFIEKAKGLSADQIVNLRSASIIQAKCIFPEKLLEKVNKENRASLHDKAMVRMAFNSTANNQRKPKNDEKPNKFNDSKQQQGYEQPVKVKLTKVTTAVTTPSTTPSTTANTTL